MSDKLEQLSFICDDILTNPHIDAQTVLNTVKLASEDNYLYDLLVDYMKSKDDSTISDMYLTDALNYTEEKLRTKGLK